MTPNPSRRRPWLITTFVLLVALASLTLFFWPRHPPGYNPEAAVQANLRGIGLMEQFQYHEAANEFAECVRLDPDWLPGQINLAIALLNTADADDLVKATALLKSVLQRDPDNRHAHYCLGVIDLYQNRMPEAAAHFETVTRLDPNDAYAWYHRALTTPERDDAPEAKKFFQKALELNPYLNAARFGLAQHRFERDDNKSKALLAEFVDLTNANWESDYRLIYTEMGPYGNVIGRSSTEKARVGPVPLFERDGAFQVNLAEGTRWAKAADLGVGILGDLHRAVRDRFGATIVRLDYDGDGRADLLLLGAVVRNGKLGDLLLHNEGNGRFVDVTTQIGLADAPASFGCSVADFDNDGRPDLLLTGPTGVRLFRNVDGKRYEDKTKDASLDALTGVFLGASWIDIDQDGDLDLLLARYADTPEAALRRFREAKGETGGMVVFLNIGEALPQQAGSPMAGLTCRFQRADKLEALLLPGPIVTLAACDLDGDRDVDFLILVDGQFPQTILNDRLLRFHREATAFAPKSAWNGALVLDANHDEQADLLLLPLNQPPVLLVSKRDTPSDTLAGRFERGPSNGPPLLQAQAVDLDRDGWMDVVGLSNKRELAFLHNDGGRLVYRSDALNPEMKRGDLWAVAACALDKDRAPDILLWSEAEGLQAWRNLDNGNHALRVDLSGRREKARQMRTNADGIGAFLTIQSGQLRSSLENTTLSAGLGQSRLPLELGLGRATTADLVRIRWPDGVPQTEINQMAGQVLRIVETNRKGTSCPVLLTWDGERFAFITDFLGAGSMGELGADGTTRPPRPEESIKIEPGRLVPRDGKYLIKIAEPMDEVLYIDHVWLDVIDHPSDLVVYPDERFVVEGPQPSQDLLAFRDKIFAKKAIDHRGRDVTELLRKRNGKMVDGFAVRSWLGFAENHFVELDFGDQLQTLNPSDRLFLVLAGWTDYPYPESIFAANQGGVPMTTPILEKLATDGKWQSLGELGFPAGLPRVMTAAMRGLAGEKACRLRIRTNVQIYWDQIYLAPLTETVTADANERIRVHNLEVDHASLVHRGFMREITPEIGPITYDDARTEPVTVSRWQGKLTRTGDVTDLLRKVDDRFVVSGPGDEITIEFDARKLPVLPAGYQRSFVLRTRGYSKDVSPFTATGGRVEPLPFRKMKNYPPEGTRNESVPDDDAIWRTRSAGRR